jgi:hypothetical protein
MSIAARGNFTRWDARGGRRTTNRLADRVAFADSRFGLASAGWQGYAPPKDLSPEARSYRFARPAGDDVVPGELGATVPMTALTSTDVYRVVRGLPPVEGLAGVDARFAYTPGEPMRMLPLYTGGVDELTGRPYVLTTPPQPANPGGATRRQPAIPGFVNTSLRAAAGADGLEALDESLLDRARASGRWNLLAGVGEHVGPPRPAAPAALVTRRGRVVEATSARAGRHVGGVDTTQTTAIPSSSVGLLAVLALAGLGLAALASGRRDDRR